MAAVSICDDSTDSQHVCGTCSGDSVCDCCTAGHICSITSFTDELQSACDVRGLCTCCHVRRLYASCIFCGPTTGDASGICSTGDYVPGTIHPTSNDLCSRSCAICNPSATGSCHYVCDALCHILHSWLQCEHLFSSTCDAGAVRAGAT